MKREPLVSVLLPCKNNFKYIREAVTSILQQSYDNWELILIDDGSETSLIDELGEIRDNKIKIHRINKSRGISYALNYGLKYCNGKYIARFDSDDICLPERLEYQVNFMDSFTDVGLSGGLAVTLGEDTQRVIGDDFFGIDIGSKLVLKNFIVHPTVIIRKSVILQHNFFYNEKFHNAEDYELWARLACVTKIANLPKILIKYRIHPESQTTIGKIDQIKLSLFVQKKMINEKKFKTLKFQEIGKVYYLYYKKLFYLNSFKSKKLRMIINFYHNSFK